MSRGFRIHDIKCQHITIINNVVTPHSIPEPSVVTRELILDREIPALDSYDKKQNDLIILVESLNQKYNLLRSEINDLNNIIHVQKPAINTHEKSSLFIKIQDIEKRLASMDDKIKTNTMILDERTHSIT